MDIKNLQGSERPREKLLRLGAGALSDAELVAIILGTGTKKTPVLELADKLIETDKNGILFLADCVPEELCRISGIGRAKACSLTAAMELGKRIVKRPKDGKYVVTYADQAANLIMEDMRHLRREIFLVMLLSSKGEIISFEKVAEGDINTAAVKGREIFQAAVRRNAFSVILAHNHPSGDPSPSDADIAATNRLIEAGELLGIYVADHIIIGNNKYYSFKENKIMK